ncbi:MAG: response regulator [Gemmatimonadaceae bacterium]
MATRDERILIVDDQAANARLLERILVREGFTAVSTTDDGGAAVRLFAERPHDLVCLDLNMPGMDGFAVLEQLVALTPKDTYLPVLMLTGDTSGVVRRRALSAGAKDFLGKPFDSSEAILRIKNLLETRRLHLELRRQNDELEAAVAERTRELRSAQVEILARLAGAAEFRDDETGRHTYRVAHLSGRLASRLNLPLAMVELVTRAAPLHDVGKIGIPDRILLKPGRLDEDEMAVMKTHTTIGAEILAEGRTELVQVAERVARSHHERWDGRGYPQRLKGEEIPMEARVVAVADVFDALTHDRPYRKAWPMADVLAHLRSERGRYFDPRIADALLVEISGDTSDPIAIVGDR